MEAIYIPELNQNDFFYSIDGDELKHIKALRINLGGHLIGINGLGLAAEVEITEVVKNFNRVKVIKFYENFNELPFELGLAIGHLYAKDRLEFVIEKAVELGARDIYILNTQYTQKITFKPERLKAKAIAAMKQCKRSFLPNIHGILSIQEILSIFPKYGNIILCEPGGEKPHLNETKNSLLLIGPEGGFTNTEVELFKKYNNLKQWDLGSRRLRAETAAITAMSYFSLRLSL